MNSYNTAQILAVDDTPDNLFLLETVLSEVDSYQLRLAESGEAALEAVADSPPDIILLDVMMPGLDGYEVAKTIRSQPELPYIPILLLTAHEQSSLVTGLDAGADDFLRKPFDVDELLARVRSMVRLKHSIDAHRYMIQQRDDFVARLTHDLRTPLVAANRVLDLCLHGTFGPIAEDAKSALEQVVTNNSNLLAMANTLLEVYRHDAGQKLFRPTMVSLEALAEDVVQELNPLASEKNLELSLDVKPNPTLNGGGQSNGDKSDDTVGDRYKVKGDSLELRRLITNLVGNAIKFTDRGSVELSLYSHGDMTYLSIKDTGPGISRADQEEIFDWFRQGTHMRAGSGLGLHLSQRIAQTHGGNISLDSCLGQGSTFTLSLPSLKE